MKIALAQMTVCDGEPQQNLFTARQLIVASAGADVFLLPELWTTGYSYDRWTSVAATITPAICEELLDLAQMRNAWIGGSMISLAASGGLVNRFWLLGPGGATVFYDKGHLFAPMREPEFLRPGRTRVRQSLGDATVAMSVCFDLRFPEMYRRDAVDGAEVFLVVSAWPEPRCAPLISLARAVPWRIKRLSLFAIGSERPTMELNFAVCPASSLLMARNWSTQSTNRVCSSPTSIRRPRAKHVTFFPCCLRVSRASTGDVERRR